jgi:hypothetical protein
MTVRCAAQISGSLGARFRRVARIAPTSGRYSVSTNSFEKAGCATSALWGGQDELAGGRELDIARTAFGIRDRDPANFRVVLGGDDHIQRRCQKAVPARDLGSILIEDDGVVVRLNPAGLKARRPCDAGAQIFDRNVETGVVASRILAPARQRQIAPAAESRAGGGQGLPGRDRPRFGASLASAGPAGPQAAGRMAADLRFVVRDPASARRGS